MNRQFIFPLLLSIATVGMPDLLVAQRNPQRSGESDDSPSAQTQPTQTGGNTRPVPPANSPTPRPAPPVDRPAPRPALPADRSAPRPAPPADRPTPRPAPPADRPTPRPAPPVDRPAPRPAPPADNPTTRPTPTADRPTTRPTPTADRPTTRPTPTADRPTTRPTPTVDRPTTRPVPTTDSLATQPVPMTDSLTTQPAPMADSPVARPAPPAERPATRPYGPPPGRSRVDIRDDQVSRTIINNVNVNLHSNYFHSPRYSHIFDDRWYRNYSSAWYPAHPISPRIWWQPAPAWGYTWRWLSADLFAHYVIDRMLTPIPYYYGTNVYYVDDMVYVDGVPYVSASAYYAQAAEIAARGAAQTPIHIVINVENPTAESAATEPPPQEEWMPIGTFAVLEDPEAAESSIVVQLATNKSGYIAGNVVNMQTDEVFPVYGAVDPESQRVAMRVQGREEIAECGLWNLTQDTLTVLLHVDAETTEERTFVRLSDPDQEELAP